MLEKTGETSTFLFAAGATSLVAGCIRLIAASPSIVSEVGLGGAGPNVPAVVTTATAIQYLVPGIYILFGVVILYRLRSHREGRWGIIIGLLLAYPLAYVIWITQVVILFVFSEIYYLLSGGTLG